MIYFSKTQYDDLDSCCLVVPRKRTCALSHPTRGGGDVSEVHALSFLPHNFPTGGGLSSFSTTIPPCLLFSHHYLAEYLRGIMMKQQMKALPLHIYH